MTSKRSLKSSSKIPSGSPQSRAALLAGSPSCPHGPGALEGAGPWEGGSDEDPPGAGLQSQQGGGVQGV